MSHAGGREGGEGGGRWEGGGRRGGREGGGGEEEERRRGGDEREEGRGEEGRWGGDVYGGELRRRIMRRLHGESFTLLQHSQHVDGPQFRASCTTRTGRAGGTATGGQLIRHGALTSPPRGLARRYGSCDGGAPGGGASVGSIRGSSCSCCTTRHSKFDSLYCPTSPITVPSPPPLRHCFLRDG